MIRKNTTQNIDVLGALDSQPLKYVEDYVESVLASRSFSNIKKPTWDTVGDSLEEIYLNSRRNHEGMMRQLDVLQEHKRLQSLSNTHRINHLKRDFVNLRDRFLKTNLFIREFGGKRRLTMKKFRNNKALQNEILKANNVMRNDLDELVEFRESIKRTAAEYRIYESVLEDVVIQSKIFGSVKDLINHCDSLMLTQLEICQLNEEKVSELENMRKRFIIIAKDAALEILGLKNTLSTVDRLYEAARTENFRWERTMKKATEGIEFAVMQKICIFDGVKYLYKALCQRRGIIPSLLKLEDRLDFIKDEVLLLQDVVAECDVQHQVDVGCEC